jgi:hypothetical protein
MTDPLILLAAEEANGWSDLLRLYAMGVYLVLLTLILETMCHSAVTLSRDSLMDVVTVKSLETCRVRNGSDQVVARTYTRINWHLMQFERVMLEGRILLSPKRSAGEGCVRRAFV